MAGTPQPFRQWAERPDCVVICGGKGTRLGPHAAGLAKSMVPVAGRPLIEHVVASWREHVGRFLFVTNHFTEQLAAHLPSLGIEYEVLIERGKGRGIAHALSQATDHVLSQRFIMVLGDCVHAGRWQVPTGLQQGIGVWPTSCADDIHNSYSVEVDSQQRVRALVEKPTALSNNLCGTGFYFLDRVVFEYVRATPPSALRNQVEITDVLASMVAAGLPLHGVALAGSYVNVTFPADLPRAAAVVQRPLRV